MSNTPSPEHLRWVKSTYSAGEGQCIEWAPDRAAATGEVPVRDSKDPDGPVLSFTEDSWTGFVKFAADQA